MRRIMFLVVAVCMLASLAGCKCRSWSHGNCDCDMDNHCYTRTPWMGQPGPVYSEPISPPTKLPSGKKL